MVAVASIEREKRRWFSFQYVNENRFIEAVKFYCAQLKFPDDDSEEFIMLSKDLQERVKNIHPCYNDFFQWLKKFDNGNRYHLRKRNERFVVAKNTILFIHHCLMMILREMENIALDILKEAADKAVDDEDLENLGQK